MGGPIEPSATVHSLAKDLRHDKPLYVDPVSISKHLPRDERFPQLVQLPNVEI